MSYSGTDFSSIFDDYIPSTDDFSDVSVTPQQTLPGGTDYGSSTSDGWSESQWADLIGKVGTTVATDYKAFNSPSMVPPPGSGPILPSGSSSGSSYSPPSAGSSSASSFTMADILKPPYIYFVGAGALVVVLMLMNKKGR